MIHTPLFMHGVKLMRFFSISMVYWRTVSLSSEDHGISHLSLGIMRFHKKITGSTGPLSEKVSRVRSDGSALKG